MYYRIQHVHYRTCTGKDYDMERFVKFIGEGAKYYLHGLETPTQEEFMEKYAKLIPPYIGTLSDDTPPALHPPTLPAAVECLPAA